MGMHTGRFAYRNALLKAGKRSGLELFGWDG